MRQFNVQQLIGMSVSKISNYVIPGLESYLLAKHESGSCVRLFVSTRGHQESIVPHSHRFDFQCIVLEGSVTNIIWTRCLPDLRNSDEFMVTTHKYMNTPGLYEQQESFTSNFVCSATTHVAGENYGMSHDQIHSIRFSRGAAVLFFEGPPVSDSNVVLEPLVDGVRIPTGTTQPWMFRKC